jgi:tetratricopeptide (TPR) repeat protein
MRLLIPEIVQHYSVGRMPDRKVTQVYSVTLAAALALSAQAAGAIHLPIVVAYATLVATSGFLALAAGSRFVRSRFGSHRGAPPSSPAASPSAAPSLFGLGRLELGTLVWIGLALVCLAQALPVPLGWIEAIAPSQGDIWARALRPFGLPPPELATLSLAPHRTLIEALKMASYGVIFQLSARLGRRGMGRIAALACASALLVALVTLAHRALGAERLFGVYAPSDALAAAPLLNPNNRAGYYNLGFFCGVGLLLRAAAGPRAALLGVGLVVLVVEILLCQSRGGTACLLLGMLLVPLMRPRDAPSGSRELKRPAQLALVAAIAAGAAALAIVSRPKGGFGYEESLEKLGLLARAAQLARDHFVWGVGRGAFGSAFSTYQPSAGATVYEHAENLPLQWAAEWGVPVALLALAALAWSLRPLLSRRALRSPVRRCALIGVGVLLAQNMVDLGLEITAVAALFVFVLGGLLGAALAHRQGPSSSPAGARVLSVGAGLTVLCIGLVVFFGSDSPARERERLHARLAQGAVGPELWGALERAVRAYPADPYLPLLGGAAALAEQKDAIAWAARAIERAPGSAPAQLLLARALQARHATDQALAALRRAIELEPASAPAAVRLATEWRLSPELLERAVPEGARGAPSLALLADASQPGSAERVHWLEQALARDPDSSAIHYRIALELGQDVQRGERGVMCQQRREECLRRALAHVGRASHPPTAPLAVLEGQLIEALEGPRSAEEHLARGCEPFPGDEPCASALTSLALRNRSERAAGAVRLLLAAGCGTREHCAGTHMSIGRQFAALGEWRTAGDHFRQAALEWPTAESWRALADAARALGQTDRAEDARRRAELLDSAKKGAQ